MISDTFFFHKKAEDRVTINLFFATNPAEFLLHAQHQQYLRDDLISNGLRNPSHHSSASSSRFLSLAISA